MKRNNRNLRKSWAEELLDFLTKHAYTETIIVTILYLLIGYAVDPNDICIVDKDAPYLIMFLAVITLFHGLESGILSLTIITVTMWFSYETFRYIDFLVALIMTMIYSQFHRYWTNKINKMHFDAEYRSRKISELSRAFYTLKISHDQLEKNYVVKPMSIRNSIEYILHKNTQNITDENKFEKVTQNYRDFLELLQKSFNLTEGVIVYTIDHYDKHTKDDFKHFLTNGHIVTNHKLDPSDTLENILQDYIVEKAIRQKRPVYLSDEAGEPSMTVDIHNTYLAAIPSVYEDDILGILLIKKMSFMAFNKENLTAISILLDYFMIEIGNKTLLLNHKFLPLVKDEEFNVEFTRLKFINQKYHVNSVTILIKVQSQLQGTRLYELIEKILRSLDLVTVVERNGFYNIVILLALNDKAAAKGFLNRLMQNIPTKEDKEFDAMIFEIADVDQINEFLEKEYTYVENK
ncbi:MAG: hypothetical protein GXO11_04955 [Epsilonproteobacteria bacterium]|nr:hypothetical protein [Campylobacterota bacterium]